MRKTVKDKSRSDVFFSDMLTMLCEIINFKPDFILSINHKGLDHEGLISYACRELNIPIFIWYVDNPFSITDWDHYDPPGNIIFLVFDSMLATQLNEIKQGFVYHLPLGTNPNRFKPASLSYEDRDRYGCDISFVGNLDLNKAGALRNILKKNWGNIPAIMWNIMDSIICMVANEPEMNFAAIIEEEMKKNGGITYPGREAKRLFEICVEFESSVVYRANTIKKIIQAGKKRGSKQDLPNIKVFGKEEWEDVIDAESLMGQVPYRENLRKVYNASKINLNISRIQLRSGLNQRAYDVPACKGFLITDYKKELEDSFDVGREIVCYHCIDELLSLIDYYLKNSQERQKISDAGFNRVLNEHTYHHRMKQLIEIYDKNKEDTDSARSTFHQDFKLIPDRRVDIRLALCWVYAQIPDIYSCIHHCEIILKCLDLNSNIVLNGIEDLAEIFSRIKRELEKGNFIQEALLADQISEYLTVLTTKS